MPVVINDFEIIAEPTPATGQAPGAAAKQTTPGSSPVSPLEIEHVLEFHMARLARVTAD
jgi:hypothetical protein